MAGVSESPADPFDAHGHAVLHQGLVVAPPHFDGRMVLPPLGSAGQHSQDDEGFDSLFAQSPVVENSGRLAEVG